MKRPLSIATSASSFLFLWVFIFYLLFLLFYYDIIKLFKENIDDTRKSPAIQQILKRRNFGSEETGRQNNWHGIEIHFVVFASEDLIPDEVDHVQNDVAIQSRQTVDDVFDQINLVFLLDSLQCHHFVVGGIRHNGMVEFGEQFLNHACHCIPAIWPSLGLLQHSHGCHLGQFLDDFFLFFDRAWLSENALQFQHLGILSQSRNQTHQMDWHVVLVKFVLTQPYHQTILLFLFLGCDYLAVTFLLCFPPFVDIILFLLLSVVHRGFSQQYLR